MPDAAGRAGNSVSEINPGLFLLEFPNPDDVTPQKCEPLIPPLVAGAKRGPIGLIAILPNELRLLHPGMAPFWIGVLLDRVTICAVAVVTQSVAVKVVLKSVDLAMGLRKKPIRTMQFKTLAEAVEWVKPQIPLRA